LGLFITAPLVLAAAPALAQMPPPMDPPPMMAPPTMAPPPPMMAPPPMVAAPPAADTADRSTSLWYGWQTLVAVAPFDIAMFVGLAKWDESYGHATTITGFVGRNLVPGVVHMFHRRPGVGLASFGLHAAASATGVAIAYAIGIGIQENCKPLDPCRNSFRGVPPGVGYGAVAGSMAGTVLDVVFLAHRSRANFGVTGSAATEPTVAFSPFATPSSMGVAAGGTF
jgi:hypothetical protein